MALFTVRKKQVTSLEHAFGRMLEQRAYDWIEKQLPRKIARMGPVKTRALIKKALPRARAYGMITEKEILGFIHLAFLWNDGSGMFQEYADARPIFESAGYSSGEKIIQARSQFKKVLVKKVKILTANI